MNKEIRTVVRYTWIMLGLFIMANGIVFLVRAKLGVSPWDVLHLGISYQTGLTLGRIIQATGLLIILVSWVFHVPPRLVTLLNMGFVGFFVDIISGMNYIPVPDALWLKFACYLSGVAICGLGTAVYISGNRGAGPRDGLMMAITKATSLRVGTVRTIMEVTVAVIGYFLGGPLGIGTLLFALFVGVFVELGFAGIEYAKQTRVFQSLWAQVVEMAPVAKH